MSRRQVFSLCAFPALSTILLASDGRTPAALPSAPATEAASERGVPALFSWGDVDGDGRLDLAAVGSDGTLQVLANAGDGRFEDVTERVGLFDVGNAALALWADYDGDGRLDLFVGAREGASRLFHNDYGVFIDVSARSGVSSEGTVQSAQWLDGDGDGHLDLFVVTAKKSQLFRGLAGGFFKAVELPSALSMGTTGATRTTGTTDTTGTTGATESTDSTGATGAKEMPAGAGVSPWVEGTAGERPDPDIDVHGTHNQGSVPRKRRASGGSNAVVTSTTLLGGPHFPAPPPSTCFMDIMDQAVPAVCLGASTTPTLGLLYPLSTNLFVTPAGKVGCGTTAPESRLHVYAGSAGGVTANLFSVLTVENNTHAYIELLTPSASERGILFDDPINGSNTFIKYNTAAVQGGFELRPSVGSGNLMAITGTGRVGIGTPSPLAKLDVLGGADAGGGSDPVALAFQHRSGGFRHFIRSRHNSVADDAGNGIDFFLNNSIASGTSTAPGTGNVRAMTLNASLAGRLDVSGGIMVDSGEVANGTTAGPMLRFGPVNSGEGLLSKRTAGGNQFGLDMLTGSQSRLAITLGGNVGIGTTSPTAKLEVAGTTRMTDTLTLAPSGDVALDVSSGNIYKAGVLFIHANSLSSIAMGEGALMNAMGEVGNTAIGRNALKNNTTGRINTALGIAAGYNLTTGSYNVSIASPGVAGESNTTRIGNFQTRAFIKGIRGVTTGAADAIPVLVDSAGQLGTVSSSRRFKEEIHDMGASTDRLLELRPVTFRYKPEVQKGERPLEYGLIAEEVAEVFPDLVVYDEEGKPFTVKYHIMSSMLLNEMKKLAKEVEEQRNELARLHGFEARLAALETRTRAEALPSEQR